MEDRTSIHLVLEKRMEGREFRNFYIRYGNISTHGTLPMRFYEHPCFVLLYTTMSTFNLSLFVKIK
jgi:hypothetical protein